MTERAQFPFATEYDGVAKERESDVTGDDGNPGRNQDPGYPGVREPSDLLVTRSDGRTRFWQIGVLATVVCVLIIALIALFPPLLRQERPPAPGPQAGGGPPVGCPPPIPPPPDAINGRPPNGGRPQPLPGKCPPPPDNGNGYQLVFTGKQIDVSSKPCRTAIDIDTMTATDASTEADLAYETCGAAANLRQVPGRAFGEFGIFPPVTGEECRASALGRPLATAPEAAPSLLGYCVITSRKQVAHVLVQVWGKHARPELRIQVTLWRHG
jgi:hypothetical protein